MEKMKCDIIQDLIPSYVDEICSDATRECVEEHIKSCKECQQMVVLCREHTPSGKKVEQKSLDGLKKIKQIGQLKGLGCCGLVLFLLVYLGFNLFVFKKNVWSFSSHTVMLIVCMILVLLSGLGYDGRALFGNGRVLYKDGRALPKDRKALSWDKRMLSWDKIAEYVMSIVACLICIYIFMLSMGITRVVLAGKNSFWGMELIETGPFIEIQIITGFVICMIFWLYALFRILKYGKVGNWSLCLLVTDIFLLFQHALWLGRMDTQETIILDLIYVTVQTVLIGSLGIAASILIANYSRRKRQGI